MNRIEKYYPRIAHCNMDPSELEDHRVDPKKLVMKDALDASIVLLYLQGSPGAWHRRYRLSTYAQWLLGITDGVEKGGLEIVRHMLEKHGQSHRYRYQRKKEGPE